jgi:hypothetical protein
MTLPVLIASMLIRALIWGAFGLNILSSMNVQFMVIDPEGRRTGYDLATRSRLSEIPSSHYEEKYTGVSDGGIGEKSRDFVAAFGSPGELVDGPYTLRVYGETSGPFWLSISVYREPVSEDFNIRGTIRRGEMKVYRLRYAGDLSVPITIDTLRSAPSGNSIGVMR